MPRASVRALDKPQDVLDLSPQALALSSAHADALRATATNAIARSDVGATLDLTA